MQKKGFPVLRFVVTALTAGLLGDFPGDAMRTKLRKSLQQLTLLALPWTTLLKLCPVSRHSRG